MPYRKPYRKRRRRGRRGKSYLMWKRRPKFYTPAPRKSLLGNSRAVRMRYVTGVPLAGDAVGNVSSYIMSANSLNDPDRTGTGHQPRGFDQIIALYTHYTVISSKCSAWFTPAFNISGIPDGLTQMVGISLRAGSTGFLSSASYLEDRNVNYRCAGNWQQGSPVKTSLKFTPMNYLSIKSPQSDHTLKGTHNTNPSEEAFFHVFAAPITHATDNGDFQVSITIDYVAVFTEPILPAES